MDSSRDRGDTLIEVMLALVFLAVIIIGAVTMMNRGKNSVLVALENTEVRMHMSGQTELLRYLRNQYIRDPNTNTTWKAIVDAANTTAFNGGCDGATPNPSTGKNSFFFNSAVTNVVPLAFTSTAPTEVASPGNGLWIEAMRSAPLVTPAFVDFQVTACWPGLGNIDSRELKSTTRFYDPSR